MARPRKSWDQLSLSAQKRLHAKRDPRVPADFIPDIRPVGRPKGMRLSLETRRRMSAARTRSDDYIARKTAGAIGMLLDIFGTREAIVKEIMRDTPGPTK